MENDPELKTILERARDRQTAYAARFVEVGVGDDRGRDRPGEPEARRPAVPDQGGQPATQRTGDSRATPALPANPPSAPASASDEPAAKRVRTRDPEHDGEDLPLPEAEEIANDEPNTKRTRYDETFEEAEDSLLEPVPDNEVGMVATAACSKRRPRNKKKISETGGDGNILRGKYDVAEMFSPPRVAARGRERGFRAGWSLDIRHEDGITHRKWDLANKDEAEEAFTMIKRDKPQVVILSPPCIKFCKLWNLCKTGVPRRDWLHAVRMVNVAVHAAHLQLDGGRHFVFEHPLSASSWRLPALRRLRARAGVTETTVHMCAFGLTSRDHFGEAPVLKPTRILTSSWAIRDAVAKKCSRDHRHVQLVSGRAAAAQ